MNYYIKRTKVLEFLDSLLKSGGLSNKTKADIKFAIKFWESE